MNDRHAPLLLEIDDTRAFIRELDEREQGFRENFLHMTHSGRRPHR